MELLTQLVQRHGRPLALYHDRHSIFQVNVAATEADSLAEQLAGSQEATQFGRVMRAFGDHLDSRSFAPGQRCDCILPSLRMISVFLQICEHSSEVHARQAAEILLSLDH